MAKDNAKFKGWRGTIKAALDHHPDKFSEDACKKKGKKGGKLCPWAIFTKDKEEGKKPHYKEQPSSIKGTPKKKKEFKNEAFMSFTEYAEARDNAEKKKKKKMDVGSLNAPMDMP